MLLGNGSTSSVIRVSAFDYSMVQRLWLGVYWLQKNVRKSPVDFKQKSSNTVTAAQCHAKKWVAANEKSSIFSGVAITIKQITSKLWYIYK